MGRHLSCVNETNAPQQPDWHSKSWLHKVPSHLLFCPHTSQWVVLTRWSNSLSSSLLRDWCFKNEWCHFACWQTDVATQNSSLLWMSTHWVLHVISETQVGYKCLLFLKSSSKINSSALLSVCERFMRKLVSKFQLILAVVMEAKRARLRDCLDEVA